MELHLETDVNPVKRQRRAASRRTGEMRAAECWKRSPASYQDVAGRAAEDDELVDAVLSGHDNAREVGALFDLDGVLDCHQGLLHDKEATDVPENRQRERRKSNGFSSGEAWPLGIIPHSREESPREPWTGLRTLKPRVFPALS